MLDAIISKALFRSGCSMVLSGDGITVSDLSMKGVPGVFGAASVDIRSAKKSMPAIGHTASIAKNLDEYQVRICSFVPTLADSDWRKLHLQKYRAATIAAFAMLATILKNPSQEILGQWNTHAKSIMEEMSEVYLAAKSNSNSQVKSRKEAFEFFRVPEEKLVVELQKLYE